jgi:class 3 adenylate cyclase
MDPEDLREVISAYQKCAAETVGRFGGFVAKYMGDGVLIYFGYPQAHEDDAERAVRPGLELVAAVGDLTTHGGNVRKAKALVPKIEPFGLSTLRHEPVGPSIRGMNGELARHSEG